MALGIMSLGIMALAGPAAAEDAPKTIALVGAEVLGPDFATWAHDRTVIVTGNRITAIGPAAETPIPDGAQIVDMRGRWIIPGLWDAHIHSRYKGIDHLRLLISHGITATRDLGGPWEHLPEQLAWRREIAAGTRVGPRWWTAGTVLNNPGARWSHITVVHDPDEARAAVDRLKREGADFVKVYSDLTPENYRAILAEAKAQGLPVDGHDPDAIPPLEASRAGQRVIEHAREVALALIEGEIPKLAGGYTDWTALENRLSAEKADEMAATFRENGTWLDPTLNLRRHFIGLAEKSDFVLDNPALRFIPRPYLDAWKMGERPTTPEIIAQWQANLRLESEAVRMLAQRGVPILAGTDTVKPFYVPGDGLHEELFALVDAGLSQGEAIRAATINPARMTGMKDLGLVQPGFLADLLVLDADPLADIGATRQIAMVIANGRAFDRAALDAMQADIAANAAAWDGVPTGR
ncbi:amidohydrolase family protein [Croceicoccus mobilis]|nr:amidohydrolase family protein [Croceicoccus mobilis]